MQMSLIFTDKVKLNDKTQYCMEVFVDMKWLPWESVKPDDNELL